jgi:hypothetical protein
MSQALLDVVSLNIKLIRGNISFFKFLVQEQLLNSCNESGQIINNYLKLRLNYVRNLLVYGVETGEFRQLDIDLTCMFITGTFINGLLFNTHYVSQQVSDTAFDERLLKNFKEYINHMLKS